MLCSTLHCFFKPSRPSSYRAMSSQGCCTLTLSAPLDTWHIELFKCTVLTCELPDSDQYSTGYTNIHSGNFGAIPFFGLQATLLKLLKARLANSPVLWQSAYRHRICICNVPVFLVTFKKDSESWEPNYRQVAVSPKSVRGIFFSSVPLTHCSWSALNFSC